MSKNLTKDQVLDILVSYYEKAISPSYIANYYDISKKTVFDIVDRNTHYDVRYTPPALGVFGYYMVQRIRMLKWLGYTCDQVMKITELRDAKKVHNIYYMNTMNQWVRRNGYTYDQVGSNYESGDDSDMIETFNTGETKSYTGIDGKEMEVYTPKEKAIYEGTNIDNLTFRGNGFVQHLYWTKWDIENAERGFNRR